MMEYWTIVQPTPDKPGYLMYKGNWMADLYLDGHFTDDGDDDE